jgi:uncharacterized protein YecE (DUF72 family)
MRKGLHIGTSGWSYEKDWKDVFYYSRDSMLRQYLSVFHTAEINSTFYALPRPTLIKHLSKSVREDVFFTAKLPRKVTHDSRLHLDGEGGEVLTEFFSLMKPLGKRLEALLIQLPPWKMSSMGNFENFLSQLDPAFRYAVEFRDESWLTNSTWKLLEDYGLAHVVVDEPKLEIDLRITSDFSYIRWHGHGTNPWFNYQYSMQELEMWKPRLENLLSRTETVFGYFNNHFGGKAPLNALQMLSILQMISPAQKRKLERMEAYLSVEQTSLEDF